MVTGNTQDCKSTVQRVIIRRRLGNQIQQVGYEKVKRNNDVANNFNYSYNNKGKLISRLRVQI